MQNELTRGQRILMIAGLAGSCQKTVGRFLNGEPIRGEALRARLAEAVKEVAKMHPQQQAADQQA